MADIVWKHQLSSEDEAFNKLVEMIKALAKGRSYELEQDSAKKHITMVIEAPLVGKVGGELWIAGNQIMIDLNCGWLAKSMAKSYLTEKLRATFG